MKDTIFSFVIFLCAASCLSKDIRCGENEFLRCGECPPERICKNRDIAYNCSVEPGCDQSCVCKEGFIRDRFNKCIPDDICDTCTGPNENWDCGPACDNECKTMKYQNRTNCPIQNIVCNEKCYCDDGYARNAAGVCISVDKCWQPTSTSPSLDCASSRWWWFFRAGVFYVAYPDCSDAATIRQGLLRRIKTK